MGIRTGVGNEIRVGSSRVARHVLLAGFAAGCIGNSERTAQPASRSIIADVILSVDNRTRSPVVIYVGAEKMSDSLGVVPAHGIGLFSIPSGLGSPNNPAQLESRDRDGVPNARSPAFHISSSHQIIWTIDRSRRGTITKR